MKIAISGVHGQGKTTLINELKKLDEFKHFKFVDSPTRALIGECGINESGTQDTQVAIMFQHYINQINDNIITDRCALDGMAYTNYFTPCINLSIMNALQKVYYYLMQQYDIVFYIEPELPPENDGTRSTLMPFFEAIKNNFEFLIKNDKLKVTSLSGTVEQRVRKFLDTYNIYTTIYKK